jgi:glycosyltransferase involved in cell wall biosynthesis
MEAGKMNYVNIVTSDRGWILENLATQISSRLPYVKFGDGVDVDAAIQYYITYSCRYRRISPIEVGYFAHLEPEGEAYEKFFRTAKEVDYCISHAELYAHTLREHGIANVTAISPGVDLDRFMPKIRIGVVGRTYHTGRKGEHVVDQVMDIPEIEWSFTGEGWPDPALKLPDAVLPDFYRQLDYVLVPALYEGGPMSVVEALACGTEVISPPIGWVPEFPHIEYKVGDASDLRRVLLELVQKKRKLRETTLSRTWDAWAEGHDRVFRDLAARNGFELTPPPRGSLGRYPRRIGLFLHGSEGKSPGGPTVRVPRLGRELRELGSDASMARHPGADMTQYDIAHIFNAWAPKTALDAIRRARNAGAGVVFSPIFLDLSMRPLWQDDLPRIFEISESEAELEGRLQQYQADCERQRASTQPPPEPVPGYYSSVRSMMSLADHAIFLSEREKKRLDLIGADTSRGTVVHNPVDWQLFSDGDPSLFEQEYGIKNFIICVARQESRKNQLMLMRALQGTSIPLVLVGHAANAQYVELMKRYRTPNVHLIERLPPNSPMLASAFAASRVAVLPSWAEGAPLAALEAAATGASLVLSDESGESEYFGSWARYCDPASASSMRRALFDAYETHRTPEQVGAQKSFIADNFNWDRHRDATREVYRLVHQRCVQPTMDDLATQAVEDSGVPAAVHSAVTSTPRIDIVYDVTSSANHKGRWTGIARVEAALAIALQQNKRISSIRFVAWNNQAQAFVDIPFETIRAGKTSNMLAHYDTAKIRPMKLPEGAFYIVGGSGWMQNSAYVEGLTAFKYSYRLKLTPIIHDVIPVRFPFWFNENYAPTFNHNLLILLGNSDLIVSISECTKSDIRAFADGQLDLFIPPVCTFREGDEISQIPVATPLPEAVETLLNEPFVLCVGAIHQRKNHKLLYDVWIKLRERMGGRCPKLVLVGGVAWNGHDIARAMQGDARVRDHIRILEHIDDHVLEWLYRNCIFTVYPSLYEGWGLPVSESLRYGKVCIASNASSVPEVAPGFVELLDPVDMAKWLAMIQFLANSRQAREAREAHIKANYRTFTWAESAETLIDSLVNNDALPVLERPYTPGTVAGLMNRTDAARYKRGGWHLTEKWGCWSSGLTATLSFDLPESFVGDAVFTAEVKAFSFPGSNHDARILVNGIPVGRWLLTSGDMVVRHVIVPASVLAGRRRIDVQIDNANLTPIATVSKSHDRRSVGLGMGRFALAPSTAVAHAGTYLGIQVDEKLALELGRSYDFFKDAASRVCLDGQWTVSSSWGAFNTDMRPRMFVVIQDAPGQELEIELVLRPVAAANDPLTLIVLVNDIPSCSWTFSDDGVHRVRVPVSRHAREASEPITVDLVPSDIRSPRDIGIGGSDAAFGFGLFSMRLLTPSTRRDLSAIPYEVGQKLRFTSSEPETPFHLAHLPGPWYGVEPSGVWSVGSAGVINLRLKQPRSTSFMLQLEVRAFGPPASVTEAAVIINGHRIGSAVLNADAFRTVELPVEAEYVGQDGLLVIEIAIPTASSPARLGTGADCRLLGIRLGSLSLHSAALLSPGTVVPFTLSKEEVAQELSEPYIQGGWFPSERSGRWSRGDQGGLSFVRLPAKPGHSFFVAARVVGTEVDSPAYVDVLVNGHLVDTWLFWDNQVVLADVQGFAEAVGVLANVRITFRRRNPCSPRDLGLGSDSRKLGLLVTGCVLLEEGQGIDEAASLLRAAGCTFHKPIDRDRVPGNGTTPIAYVPQPGLKGTLELVATRGTVSVTDITMFGSSNEVLGNGWYVPEADGTWSHAYGARLNVEVLPGTKSIELIARVFGTAVGPAIVVARFADGTEHLFRFHSDSFGLVSIPVEGTGLDESGSVSITLTRLGAISPKQVGMGSDDRPLGLLVRSICTVMPAHEGVSN